jgi:hypothetical protein
LPWPAWRHSLLRGAGADDEHYPGRGNDHELYLDLALAGHLSGGDHGGARPGRAADLLGAVATDPGTDQKGAGGAAGPAGGRQALGGQSITVTVYQAELGNFTYVAQKFFPTAHPDPTRLRLWPQRCG